MLGCMPSLYEMTADVPFVAPVMVGAFDGWIDASAAATSAAAILAENGEVVARFDGDALYDYRARRPVLDVVDGTLAKLEWPELTVRSVEAGGRHLLILTGPEPDYHWRQLGTDVLDLCLRAGVVQWVSLGAIPAAVPHTRPVPVLATASREGLLHEDEAQGPQGLLRVPGAALSTLELAVSGTGIPAVGFFAQVPHYVGGPFAVASIALLEHLGRHLQVELPLGSLITDAQEQRDRLDAAVAADEDAGAYLQRLEALAGEDRLTSGDELASEIERFLSERSREGGDDAGPFEGR
jgi:PAC2 family